MIKKIVIGFFIYSVFNLSNIGFINIFVDGTLQSEIFFGENQPIEEEEQNVKNFNECTLHDHLNHVKNLRAEKITENEIPSHFLIYSSNPSKAVIENPPELFFS